MSEYTPTTEDIRKYYGLGRYEFSPGVGAGHPSEFYQEFEAWHAAELRKARSDALREAAEPGDPGAEAVHVRPVPRAVPDRDVPVVRPPR